MYTCRHIYIRTYAHVLHLYILHLSIFTLKPVRIYTYIHIDRFTHVQFYIYIHIHI